MISEVEIETELENFGLKHNGEYSKVLAQLTENGVQEEIICYFLLDEGFVLFSRGNNGEMTSRVPQVVPFCFVKNLSYNDGFFSLKVDFIHEESTYHLSIPHRKMSAKWQHIEYKKFLLLLTRLDMKEVQG